MLKPEQVISQTIQNQTTENNDSAPSVIPQSGAGEDRVYANLTPILGPEILFPVDP